MQPLLSCYVQASEFFISWEIQSFGGGKEERSLRFLSLSQVTLIRARATSGVHMCKAPDCGSTSDLKGAITPSETVCSSILCLGQGIESL